MERLRTTVGIGLLSALTIIIVCGFFARSSRELLFCCCGFAAGLLAVYFLERLHAART